MNVAILTGPLRVVARFAALPELLAPLQPTAGGLAARIDRRVLLRAQVAVEELFANSIHHGYGRECDAPVWLSLARSDGGLQVEYADAAGAFDPFAVHGALSAQAAGPVGERRIGGLGCLLVRELAERCEYRREHGRNVVRLEFRGR